MKEERWKTGGGRFVLRGIEDWGILDHVYHVSDWGVISHVTKPWKIFNSVKSNTMESSMVIRSGTNILLPKSQSLFTQEQKTHDVSVNRFCISILHRHLKTHSTTHMGKKRYYT